MAIPSPDESAVEPAQLAAALRTTTERLASELDAPSASPPDWTPFEWAAARASVFIHGTAGVLLNGLRWPGMPAWRAFLDARTREVRERELRTRALLDALDAAARDAGLPVIALKGSALLALGIYAPGERSMADVDLLARSADAPRLEGLLAGLGFSPVSQSWKHREFAQPGDTVSRLKIDLHLRLAESFAYRRIELPGDLFGSSPDSGVLGYPSKVVLLHHLLLHTAANMGKRWARAIHLCDIARVGAALSPEEWERAVARQWASRGYLFPPLALTARYFPRAIPAPVLAELGRACARRPARAARRWTLTEVSASNPRTLALPELSWCGSPLQMLRYLQLRVFPPRDELDSLQAHASRSEFARHQSWFSMSHPARIVHWLTSRPMRPATLHAFRMGLKA